MQPVGPSAHTGQLSPAGGHIPAMQVIASWRLAPRSPRVIHR